MMTEQEFTDAICAAKAVIKQLPPKVQPCLTQAVVETIARHQSIVDTCKKARRSAAELESAQADMSLAMKYTLFNLECLARELKGK